MNLEQGADRATPLTRIIDAALQRAGGWLPFDRFMAMALYAPGLGYYANASRKFGQMPDSGSDFVTAPELTPLFGRTLAIQVAEALDKTGTRFAVRPFGPFRLGGHWTPDGTEDARIVVGHEDADLAARPGVRLLGRESGLFAYLVPPV